MFHRRTSLTRRPWRVAAGAAALLGASMLATAAPASAAPMSVHFALHESGAYTVCTDMFALIPTDEYDTWGYLNNGARAQVQLWGDDPVWDDHLLTTGWAYVDASVDRVYLSGNQGGIAVQWYACHDPWMFNEDWNEPDELYVRVTVIDGDGYTLASARSRVAYLDL